METLFFSLQKNCSDDMGYKWGIKKYSSSTGPRVGTTWEVHNFQEQYAKGADKAGRYQFVHGKAVNSRL